PTRHLYAFPTRRSSDLGPPPAGRPAAPARPRRAPPPRSPRRSRRPFSWVHSSRVPTVRRLDTNGGHGNADSSPRRSGGGRGATADRKSTRLNSSHVSIS